MQSFSILISCLHEALHEALHKALHTEALREALWRLCAKLCGGSARSSIPCNVDAGPILIDKFQPIRSLGSWSRDKEYKALTKGSNLGSCQGSGGSSFATRVGGTTYLVG
jgi:hypothetical protein